MNRYPFWRYALIGLALIFSLIYTLPNFYGESPAVQISSQKATIKVDAATESQALAALDKAGIPNTGVLRDDNSVKIRFESTDTQLRARDVLEKAMNPDPADPVYITALNLLSASPTWLTQLHALPMYLGLDLRGGVHFLMQIDTTEALNKRLDSAMADVRTLLRDRKVRHNGIKRNGKQLVLDFASEDARTRAQELLRDNQADLAVQERGNGDQSQLLLTLTESAMRTFLDNSVQQNITTLNNRINELGVAEPVIQRQGADRIVVQLPGVQDTARAKDILGRTATLEARLVDMSPEAQRALTSENGVVPFGSDLFRQGRGAPVVLRREPIFTGQQLTNASATFDEHQQPAVAVSLNEAGGRHLREVSRKNIHKPMAVVLFEKGKGEVLTVATIQSELGSRFQITGMGSAKNAGDLALLLRAGALAAPMDIIEERTIGPSLGAENISKGFHSVTWGFLAIAVFMSIYYMLFGLFSTVALGFNLLMLVAVLSLLQATLTLPGIAAIALTLGMAIDANVLINERVREELRKGASPQMAISAGYEHAWATILDANVTTLIAGLALLAFGSGPIKGFAVVHCLGILTSMFSAVFVSRDVLIRLPLKEGVSAAKQAETVLAALKKHDPSVELRRNEFVGPQVGHELATSGAMALLVVIAGIVIYLAVRFEWKFGVAGIIANLHDVVIILGFFAFFQWEFSLSVLAAVLAVLGYSVNESVIIFDRVREKFRERHARNMTTAQVLDHAITTTTSRTVITHTSTLMMVLSMLFFGGPTLHYFSLALAIGICFGVYSSIFVAAAIVMRLGLKREDLVKPVKKKDATEVELP